MGSEDFKGQVRNLMDGIADQADIDRKVEEVEGRNQALRTDPNDEFWCLATRTKLSDGSTEVRIKAISDPPDILRLMKMGGLESTGPDLRTAQRRLHWQYAVAMAACRYGKLSDANLRKRATMATFHISDVVDR